MTTYPCRDTGLKKCLGWWILVLGISIWIYK